MDLIQNYFIQSEFYNNFLTFFSFLEVIPDKFFRYLSWSFFGLLSLLLLWALGILPGNFCSKIAHLAISRPFLWFLLLAPLGRYNFQNDSESSVFIVVAVRLED